MEYRQLKRAGRGVVLAYLQRLSGYSHAQLTRLVSCWVEGKPLVKNYRRPEHAFVRRCTAADVALLVEVDRAMGTLSGPATACALRHQRDVFKDTPFERLGNISIGHLYSLRNRAPYRAQRVVLTKTRPTRRVDIGVRKAPALEGRPGFMQLWIVWMGASRSRTVPSPACWQFLSMAKRPSTILGMGSGRFLLSNRLGSQA